MKRSWMVLGLLTAVLGAGPAAAQEDLATGEEILLAVESGAPSEIVSALLRGEAVQCFACIRDVERLLYHSDEDVRHTAGIWLRKRPLGFGPVMVRTEETVLDRGLDPATRAMAAEALGNFMDWHAGDTLTEVAASDPDAGVRAAAVRGLSVLNVPRFGSAITAALGDRDARVRAAALDAAMELFWFSDHAAIVPLVADPDAAVRSRAALAISDLGIEEGAPALEAIVLTDEDPWVRQNAAYALGVLGATEASETLEALAEDENRWVRSAARVALAMLR